jgi:hypothetical protein
MQTVRQTGTSSGTKGMKRLRKKKTIRQGVMNNLHYIYCQEPE